MIGVTTGGAQTGPKPDFGTAGANWSREGWFVPVDYRVLNNQIRPEENASVVRKVVWQQLSITRGRFFLY